MVCPFCQSDVTVSEYCAVCGKKISEECPVCGHLHPKQTRFCLKYGTSISSYLTKIKAILNLITEFESSKEHLEKIKAGSIGCAIALIGFFIAIVLGMVAGVIHSIWHIVPQPLTAIAVMLGILSFFVGLGMITDFGKDTDRFDRIDFLKQRGITDPYWINMLTFSENVKETLKRKLIKGDFFE
jgi:uncharacterized membrane protein YjfL (UPF0719 family)